MESMDNNLVKSKERGEVGVGGGGSGLGGNSAIISI